MSKTWKWTLGVTLGLIILVGLGLVLTSYWGYGHMSAWNQSPYGARPMMDDYGFRGRHPMMGYGFSPFGGIFMGLGMLMIWTIPLGLLLLVIYNAVKLANKPNAPVVAQSCGNCGKAVQSEWKNCPYCGTEL